MIKLNLIISFLLSLILVSCSQNDEHSIIKSEDNVDKTIELSSAEILSIAYNGLTELNEEEIIKLVQRFSELEVSTRSTNGISIQIEDKSYVSPPGLNSIKSTGDVDVSDRIALYTVRVANGSSKNIALVSGDQRFPSVLAYFSDKDSETADIAVNELLTDGAKEVLFNQLAIIRYLEDSLRNQTIEKITKQLAVSKDDFEFDKIKDRLVLKGNTTARATIITDPTELGDIAKFGPYVNVRWDQGLPYNRLMPQLCAENWFLDNRYAVNSLVIATAQALSFFRPSLLVNNQYIDWSYLTVNQEIYESSDYFGAYVADPLERKNMVASLMKYVSEQVKIVYTCAGSSGNFTDVINFLSKCNIKVDGKQNLNPTILKSSIEAIRPVLMYGQTSTGGGHCWLVDGMCTTPTTRSTFYPGYNVYMHANMGLGKSYSGYYLVGTDGSLTFDASFAHFNKNIVMYANMRLN